MGLKWGPSSPLCLWKWYSKRDMEEYMACVCVQSLHGVTGIIHINKAEIGRYWSSSNSALYYSRHNSILNMHILLLCIEDINFQWPGNVCIIRFVIRLQVRKIIEQNMCTVSFFASIFFPRLDNVILREELQICAKSLNKIFTYLFLEFLFIL